MLTVVKSSIFNLDLSDTVDQEIFLQLENHAVLNFINLELNTVYIVNVDLNTFIAPNLFDILNLEIGYHYKTIKFAISYKPLHIEYSLLGWSLQDDLVTYFRNTSENIFKGDRTYGNLIDFNESDFQIEFYIPKNYLTYTTELLSIADSIKFSLDNSTLFVKVFEAPYSNIFFSINLLDFSRYKYLHVLFIRIGKIYKLFINGKVVRYEFGSDYLLYRKGDIISWEKLVDLQIYKQVQIGYDFHYVYPVRETLLTKNTLLYLDFNYYEKQIKDLSKHQHKIVNPSINYNFADGNDNSFICSDSEKPFTVNVLNKFSNFEIKNKNFLLLDLAKFTIELTFKNAEGNKRGSLLENPGIWRLGIYDKLVRFERRDQVLLTSKPISDGWIHVAVTKEDSTYRLILNGELHDVLEVTFEDQEEIDSSVSNLLVKKAENQDGGLCRLNRQLYPSRSWIFINLICITINVCKYKDKIDIPVICKDRYEI